MTDAEKIAFKNSLKRWGLDHIGQRMAAAKEAMEQAQEAAKRLGEAEIALKAAQAQDMAAR